MAQIGSYQMKGLTCTVQYTVASDTIGGCVGAYLGLIGEGGTGLYFYL